MIERAGFWRRCVAALVDLLLAELCLQVLVAAAFSVSSGHVTTGYAFYTSCNTKTVEHGRLELPSGVSLPPGFVPTEQGTCWSGLLNWPTRKLYVATHAERQGSKTERLTQAYPISPDGKSLVRVFNADFLFFSLFLLVRWVADRFLRGSPGRRLARIVVTDATAGATGAGLAPDLARRYARFGWAALPGLVLGATASAAALTIGPQATLSSLAWLAGSPLISAACVAAFLAILSRADTFYDAPVGTVVAPRFEIERNEIGPAERRDARATVRSDALAGLASAMRSAPRLTLALAGFMALVFAAEWWLPRTPAGPDGTVSLPTRLAYGGMDGELVFQVGQVYRLFNSIFLHASLAHLAANLLALIAAGYLLEGVIGRRLFGIVFLVGGLASSLSSVMFHSAQEVGVGASGAILALFAASLAISFRVPDGSRRAWMRAAPFAVAGPSLLQTPVLPGSLVTDFPGHYGGVAAGVVLGAIIAFVSRPSGPRVPSRRSLLIAGGVLATLLLATLSRAGWWDPVFVARLVPAEEARQTDAGWRDRGADLASRYPDDPRAVLGLAISEARAGQRDAALRNLDRAIALQLPLAPSAAAKFRTTAHVAIAGEFFTNGDLPAALQQYDATLADLSSAPLYRQRGIVEFYLKRTEAALRDLRQAVSIDPKEGYSVLWLSIVAVRSGDPDPIGATAPSAETAGWPDKIVELFDGKLDPDSTTAAGRTLDLVGNQHRTCEAAFYEGERLIMKGWTGPARPLIKDAARTCPPDFIEYGAARAELAGDAGFPQQ